VSGIEGEKNRDYLEEQKGKLLAHLREGLLHQGEYKNVLRENCCSVCICLVKKIKEMEESMTKIVNTNE